MPFFLYENQFKLAKQIIKSPYCLDYHNGVYTGVIINDNINKSTAAAVLCHYLNIPLSQ